MFRRRPPALPTDPGRSSLTGMWTDRLGVLGTRSLQILLVLTLSTVTVWALLQVSIAVIPLLLALIIAAAFNPLMRWMRDRGVPDMAAAWIALLGALTVLGGIIWAIVIAVRNQWEDLVSQAAEGFSELLELLQGLPFADEFVGDFDLDEALDQIVDFVTSAQFGSGALAGATAVGQFFAGLALFIVILFFFLKDGPRIWAFFLKPFEGERFRRGERVGAVSVATLGGYIRGTSIVALADAIGIGIGLWILGVPLALPLAVIVFITAFIPLVGATLAGVLAALVALVTNGLVTALIVVAIVVLVNQLEGNFLQPVVMAQTLKLHPLVILLALSIGTITGGIVGAILSVPIAATAWAIVKVWDKRDPALEHEGRPRAAAP
ncbi:putative PurR-regulated permease PerM [Microcella alkaliphila]|uniref:Putative PurR-regulated permease PerM n=1 Tax=Microcella alkaliphila TaxID=279828 RepID=A0A4Q7THF2_9MICO|nr:AI-2E family transporter [Microcella alkaliphila]RZT59397.1 putative PurR-regulated permease PerM [Microcella alkaliphila]